MNIPGGMMTLGFWVDAPAPSEVLSGVSYLNGVSTGNLNLLQYVEEGIYAIYFTNLGDPIAGLSPTISTFISIETGSDITPIPAISEVGSGVYSFSYFPVVPIFVRVDGGDYLEGSERYKVFKIQPKEWDIVGNTGLL